MAGESGPTAAGRWVMDASAVLAVGRHEPGWEHADARMGGALMSSVNWSEVVQKSIERGVATGSLETLFHDGGLSIMPFTAADARRAAELWPLTRSLGLSLADRTCLALAQATGRGVVTADRAWARLDVGPAIFVIR